jgi:hypothetical protein
VDEDIIYSNRVKYIYTKDNIKTNTNIVCRGKAI